jgi:hypothetical protein
MCYEDGRRIGNGEAVHGDRILIRHRDDADPDWWHRAMLEATMKVTPPSHWIEEEEEEDADPELTQADCLSSSCWLGQHEETAQPDVDTDQVQEVSNLVEKSDSLGKSEEQQFIVDKDCTVTDDLLTQLTTLKSCCSETKSALVTWSNQTKQMFFNPDHASEELSAQIHKHWGIPKKVYWLQINGVHESQVRDWPSESSIAIKVRGLGAGKVGWITIHINDEECTTKTSKTFEEMFEDRDIEVMSEVIVLPNDKCVSISERIGDHLNPGSDVEIFWDIGSGSPEEEDEDEEPYKNCANLTYVENDEQYDMIVGADQSLREWADNNDVPWAVFRTVLNEEIDPNTMIRELMDEDRNVYVRILNEEELEKEKEDEELERLYQDDQEDWKTPEDDVEDSVHFTDDKNSGSSTPNRKKDGPRPHFDWSQSEYHSDVDVDVCSPCDPSDLGVQESPIGGVNSETSHPQSDSLLITPLFSQSQSNKKSVVQSQSPAINEGSLSTQIKTEFRTRTQSLTSSKSQTPTQTRSKRPQATQSMGYWMGNYAAMMDLDARMNAWYDQSTPLSRNTCLAISSLLNPIWMTGRCYATVLVSTQNQMEMLLVELIADDGSTKMDFQFWVKIDKALRESCVT